MYHQTKQQDRRERTSLNLVIGVFIAVIGSAVTGPLLGVATGVGLFALFEGVARLVIDPINDEWDERQATATGPVHPRMGRPL